MAANNSSPESSDREISDGLLAGGTTRRLAEDQLFRQYDYFIKEGIYKHHLSEDEAFDAYADAVLSAIHHIINGAYEGRSSLKTWLYRIFHNKCVDLIRKKSTNKSSVFRTQAITDLALVLSDAARSVVQQMIEKTDKEQLVRRLNEIGAMCSRLLQLWSEGYPDKEIALLLEYKSASVVKTSRLRCLDKLRQLYNPHP